MELSQLIAPVTIALVEAVKHMEIVDKRWLPIIAMAVGTVAGIGFAIIEPASAVAHVINGMLYGAGAAGIYDVQASARNLP